MAEQAPSIALCATAPGVGLIVAATYVSVIDDAKRFRNAHTAAAYLGLVGRLHSGVASEVAAASETGALPSALAPQACGVPPWPPAAPPKTAEIELQPRPSIERSVPQTPLLVQQPARVKLITVWEGHVLSGVPADVSRQGSPASAGSAAPPAAPPRAPSPLAEKVAPQVLSAWQQDDSGMRPPDGALHVVPPQTTGADEDVPVSLSPVIVPDPLEPLELLEPLEPELPPASPSFCVPPLPLPLELLPQATAAASAIVGRRTARRRFIRLSYLWRCRWEEEGEPLTKSP